MADHVSEPTRRGFLRYLGAGAFGALIGGGITERVTSHWYTGQLAAPQPTLSGRHVDPVTHVTASGLRVHNIQTGFVAVKSVHRQYSGVDGTGLLAIAADRVWTEWLPIHAWVIEHPEGVIVIDTGETSRVQDDAYFNCDPATSLVYRSILRFAVAPEDEIQVQLRELGIAPADVRWVIQTHLHSDHAGGLDQFPRSEVIVSPLDYPNAMGALTCRYPADFSPTLIRFTPDAVDGFPQTHRLTRAGNVLIVPTPGHSNGHQSVILRDDDVSYCFAGDLAFDQTQLLENAVAGIASQPATARQSLLALRTYAASHPTVFLPSHDPESRSRLLSASTIPV